MRYLFVAALASLLMTCTAAADTGSVVVNGLTRVFDYHVPAAYDPGQPVDVLVVFHGGGGTSASIADKTGFHDLGRYAIVIYPQGWRCTASGNGTWNDNWRGCAYSQGINDVGFWVVMMDWFEANYALSGKRYVVGHSKGGMFSYHLASTSDDLTAFATWGASWNSDEFEMSSNAEPHAHHRGESDPSVCWLPGCRFNSPFPPAADGYAWWAEYSGDAMMQMHPGEAHSWPEDASNSMAQLMWEWFDLH